MMTANSSTDKTKIGAGWKPPTKASVAVARLERSQEPSTQFSLVPRFERQSGIAIKLPRLE